MTTEERLHRLIAELNEYGVNVYWNGFVKRWDVGVQKDPSLGHLIQRLIELDVKVYAPGGSTDNWHVVLPEPAYATYWHQLCNALKAAKVEVVFDAMEYVVTNHAAVVPPVPPLNIHLQAEVDDLRIALRAAEEKEAKWMHALEDAGISLHAVDGKWTASPPIRFKAEDDAIRVNVQRHWCNAIGAGQVAFTW